MIKIVGCIAEEIKFGSWGKLLPKSHNPRPRDLVRTVAEQSTLSRLQHCVTFPAMYSDDSYIQLRSVAHPCGSF
jgi:hypothetical protein